MIDTTIYERTVLMIGDSFGILKRIAFALQDRGHTIIWGETGSVGLRVAKEERPNLVVCETGLPDISGIEVCRLIKGSVFSETPIALVGKIGEERLEQPTAYWAGADDYLSGFTDRELVVARLEGLIRKVSLSNTDPTSGTIAHSAIDNFMSTFRAQEITFE